MQRPRDPICLCLGGLPGVGKSTPATSWAAHTGAIWLRIHTIEHGLRMSALSLKNAMDGTYRVAAEQACLFLRAGHLVVIDTVNPVPHTRAAYHRRVRLCAAEWTDIEVTCADKLVYRSRVEHRILAAACDPQVLDWDCVMARTQVPCRPAVPLSDTADQTHADASRSFSMFVDGLTKPR